MPHIPLRTCIACRQQFPKEKLVSVTKLKNREIVVGEKVNGRSVYFCSQKCLDIFMKNKKPLLARLLKTPITEEVWGKIVHFLDVPK